jgi:peptidoglycan/LPS O-acetylase OafA/YrhL
MLAATRNATIDGVRGYLALGVMCHHFLICWNYFRTGQWVLLDPPLFRNFAAVGVGMFFMITAYLFYRRLRGEKRPDWVQLYRARIFRLSPMYLAAITLVLAIVAVSTAFTLRVSPASLVWSVFRWATFTLFGSPDVNGMPDTYLIIAGATWTLRYEWLFYFGLPLIALGLQLIGDRPRLRLALLAISGIVIVGLPVIRFADFRSNLLLPFVLGAMVFEAAGWPGIRRWARSRAASFGLLLILVTALLTPLPLYGAPQMVLVAGAFLLIAAGADLFGVLTARVSRRLGDASYSIYLLHGILLYGLFSALVAASVDLRSNLIWLLLPAAVLAVCLISVLTYRMIEKPFIDMARRRPAPAGTLTTVEVAP